MILLLGPQLIIFNVKSIIESLKAQAYRAGNSARDALWLNDLQNHESINIVISNMAIMDTLITRLEDIKAKLEIEKCSQSALNQVGNAIDSVRENLNKVQDLYLQANIHEANPQIEVVEFMLSLNLDGGQICAVQQWQTGPWDFLAIKEQAYIKKIRLVTTDKTEMLKEQFSFIDPINGSDFIYTTKLIHFSGDPRNLKGLKLSSIRGGPNLLVGTMRWTPTIKNAFQVDGKNLLVMKRASTLGSIKVVHQERTAMRLNTGINVRHFQEHENEEGWHLIVGDILQLGYTQFRVVEIGLFDEQGTNKCEIFQGTDAIEYSDQIQGICSYCLEYDNEGEKFLVKLCQCKGTLKGIHLKCMKEEIMGKIKASQCGIASSYELEDIRCNVCHGRFPRWIKDKKTQNKSDNYIQWRPNKNYLILETINEKILNIKKRAHIVVEDQMKNAHIDRHEHCDIFIDHFSISASHARIKHKGHRFYVIDLSSLYGTYIIEKKE